MAPHKEVFHLNLYERPYEAVKIGKKTVEVRANKPGCLASRMKQGDTIVFTKCDTNEKQLCTVVYVAYYDSTKALLLSEGVEQTLSSGKDLQGGIESIESIPGYRQTIKEHGLFAIKLRLQYIENA